MSSRSNRYAAREARRLEAHRPSKEETRAYLDIMWPILLQATVSEAYSLERVNCVVSAFEMGMSSRKVPAYHRKLREAMVETIENNWAQVQPLSEDIRERIYDIRVQFHAFVASLVAEPCYQ